MICGYCKSPDVTVDHVRSCSGQRAVQPASEKQIAFLAKLLAEREYPNPNLDITSLGKAQASLIIEDLLASPHKPKADAKVTVEDGIYRRDGIAYRVYHTVHGANQQVVSRINTDVDREARKTDKFTYLGKAPLAFLRPEDKMIFEEACEFGSTYGWCCSCGAILHNDKSVELGIGPICRAKFS